MTSIFLAKLDACLAAQNSFNAQELEFIKAMEAGFNTKEDLAALVGTVWEPSSRQLNYLDSCARKAGYR